MNSRKTIFYLLMITPILAFVSIGVLLWERDKGSQVKNTSVLLNVELENQINKISDFFSQLQDELFLYKDAVIDINFDKESSIKRFRAALEARTRNDSFINKSYLLNENGKLVFPKMTQDIGDTEWEFLQRNENLLLKEGLKDFINNKTLEEELEALKNNENNIAFTKVNPSRSSINTSLAQKEVNDLSSPNLRYGWYTTIHQGETVLHFWQVLENGYILGLECSFPLILSQLLGFLPHEKQITIQSGQDESSAIQAKGTIYLKDFNNYTIYSWGVKSSEQVIASLSCSEPLSAWKLEYRGETIQSNKNVFLFLLILTNISIAIVLVAMRYQREQERAIILAGQRVSFVNQVSHELKTPLTNIRMYSEMLLENENQKLDIAEEDADPKTKKYLEIIIHEIHRLSALIQNVLSINKKSSDKIINSQVNSTKIVDTLISQFSLSLRNAGIQIEKNIEPHSLYTDSAKIEQILGNLISNVEKYAKDGKWIGIYGYLNKDHYCFNIEDKGQGIHKKYHSKIFDEFFRIETGSHTEASGTGLGLAISKQLAIKLGGDLTVNNTQQDGAQFTLTLPIKHGEVS